MSTFYILRFPSLEIYERTLPSPNWLDKLVFDTWEFELHADGYTMLMRSKQKAPLEEIRKTILWARFQHAKNNAENSEMRTY